MRTMFELLIRLQELRETAERTIGNPQLSDGEKATPYCFKTLVRECLPPEVLLHYDRLKADEPELLECPEAFAMAVLASTYRSLPASRRPRFRTHFQSPPPTVTREEPHPRPASVRRQNNRPHATSGPKSLKTAAAASRLVRSRRSRTGGKKPGTKR